MGSLSLARSGLNETAGESVAASTNPSENLPRPLINRLGLDSGLPLLIVIRFIVKEPKLQE